MSTVMAALAARPVRDTVLCTGAQALTAGEVCAAIARLGERLESLPPGPVASQLDNGLAAALLDLALAAQGRAHIALPPFFTGAQATHATSPAVAAVRAGASRGDDVLDSLVWQRHEPATTDLPPGTALITYTSGSTGAPKGVCLDRALPEAVAAALAEAMAPLGVRRHLCLLPLGVLLETVGGLYAPLLSGGTVHLPSLGELGHRGSAGLDLPSLLGTLQRHAPESLIVVPQLLQALVSAAEAGARLPSSLRMIAVGGARVPLSLLGRAAALGLPVYEGYGLSECASVVALNRPGARRDGSVGRPLPHAGLRIGADGEVIVGGPAFLGYVGDAGHRQGPWATGDLGSLDTEGFLHLKGRKKAMYITAWGRNVSPEWVESELTQHPLIAQAFVWGEGRAQAVAVLVPARPGLGPAALERAVADVNAGLPDYARVACVIAAEAPFDSASGLLTANGRPRREALFARFGAAMAAAPDPLSPPTPVRETSLP